MTSLPRASICKKRLGRQKAVPPDLLAADDAFEQARTAAVVDLVKRADRRQHVAQHAAVDGHVVGACGQLRERREVGKVRHRLSGKTSSCGHATRRLRSAPSYHARTERGEPNARDLSSAGATR